MKPFDLSRAKAGDPIITRDGTPARFIVHIPEAGEAYRVIALVGQVPRHYRENGQYLSFSGSNGDLLMVPKKKTVYVNLYSAHLGSDRGRISRWFDSVEDAQRESCTVERPIAIAVPIEIEV